MSRQIIMVAILVLTLTWVGQGQQTPSMDTVAFMTGCWEISNPERKLLVSEHWMSPAGNAMIGMARNVRNGKMNSYEFLRIVQDETGIHYVAKPSQSKSETPFKLVKWAANEAIFENPSHDFPQRVIYKLTGADSLAARIEGTMNGKLSAMDFPYTRTRCR